MMPPGQDQPWPLADVLVRLADAADHLLNDHNCDNDGWEEITYARDAARKYAGELTRSSVGPAPASINPEVTRAMAAANGVRQAMAQAYRAGCDLEDILLSAESAWRSEKEKG